MDIVDLARGIHFTSDFTGELLTSDMLESLAARSGGRILTDDYAPVDNLLAGVVRARRKTAERLLLESARRLNAQGDGDAAIEKCREALRIRPGWPNATESLANLLLKKGDDEGVVAVRKGAVDANPEDKQANYELGRALLKVGRNDEAIAAFQAALTLDPGYAAAYEKLGVAYLQKDDLNTALTALEGAVAANPKFVLAHYNLGLVYAQKGDLNKAAGEWRTVLAIEPGHRDANFNLIAALYKMEAYDEALEQVRKWREMGGTVDEAVIEALTRETGKGR